jgi:adenosylcobinamide-phosphate synthase
MSFLTLLFAFLIEQVKPFGYQEEVRRHVARMGQWIRLHLDAGLQKQAYAVWTLGALLPSLLVAALYWLLMEWGSWFMGLVWSILVLYVCLGFRQFSHHFTKIRDALEQADEGQVRQLLSEWQHVDASQWRSPTLIRHLIEYSVVAAHRHVYAVLYWYCALSVLGFGPAGAVLYRLTEMLVHIWTEQREFTEGEEVISSDALKSLSLKVWFWVDWLPARLTAMTFAVVGNFEEAIDAWRFQLERYKPSNDAVILAATAGALDLELGVTPLQETRVDEAAHELGSKGGSGQTPQVAHLNSLVGLVWRGVVMWMLILTIFGVSRWLA